MTIEAPNPNIANICTALELLTYILTVFDKDQILCKFIKWDDRTLEL